MGAPAAVRAQRRLCVHLPEWLQSWRLRHAEKEVLEGTDRCLVSNIIKLVEDEDVWPDGLQYGADIRGLGRDAGAQLYQQLIVGVPVQGRVEGGDPHLRRHTHATCAVAACWVGCTVAKWWTHLPACAVVASRARAQQKQEQKKPSRGGDWGLGHWDPDSFQRRSDVINGAHWLKTMPKGGSHELCACIFLHSHTVGSH